MSETDRSGPGVGKELREVLAAIEGLPEGDTESIKVLIDAGEWQVALETLCTQIYEYDIDLPRPLRGQLTNLGQILDVAVGYLLGDPWEKSPDGH